VLRIDDAGAIIGSEMGQAAPAEQRVGFAMLEDLESRTGVAMDKHIVSDKSDSFLVVARCHSADEAQAQRGSNNTMFYAVPRLEPFSRISGICKILGDRSCPSNEQYPLNVGDLFRVGSVGCVVTQVCLSSTEVTTIRDDQMWYLKYKVFKEMSSHEPLGEATESQSPSKRAAAADTRSPSYSSFDGEGDLGDGDSMSRATLDATEAEEPEDEEEESGMCYMCCDSTTTPENPLVAACECKGGTKWVHLGCLEKWLCSETENRSCVIITDAKELVCKVCRSPYRKYCKLDSGKIIPIPQPHLKPPYICCKVVTHNAHSGSRPSLFNATFQISASNHMTSATRSLPLHIGRSAECDVQLNYQTVSGRHATLTFVDGQFLLSDLRSSNGTFIYLREPLPLSPASPTRIRMGRKTVKLSVMNQGSFHRRMATSAEASQSKAAVHVGHLEDMMKLDAPLQVQDHDKDAVEREELTPTHKEGMSEEDLARAETTEQHGG